jgi:hypothetical protein
MDPQHIFSLSLSLSLFSLPIRRSTPQNTRKTNRKKIWRLLLHYSCVYVFIELRCFFTVSVVHCSCPTLKLMREEARHRSN